MSDWGSMGGNAVFIWASFAAAGGIVVWNILAARARWRAAREELAEMVDDESGS